MSSSIDERILRKMRKLRTMAERGEGQEKITAQRMLDSLYAQHGLDDSGLDNSELIDCEFYYQAYTDIERTLMHQVMLMVAGERDPDVRKYRSSRQSLLGKFTEAQQSEVELLFEHYREALAKEIDRTVRAFVMTNDLYGNQDRDKDEMMTPEELRELYEVMKRAQGMGVSNPNKLLESK